MIGACAVVPLQNVQKPGEARCECHSGASIQVDECRAVGLDNRFDRADAFHSSALTLRLLGRTRTRTGWPWLGNALDLEFASQLAQFGTAGVQALFEAGHNVQKCAQLTLQGRDIEDGAMRNGGGGGEWHRRLGLFVLLGRRG
ncbi:hypothetical protein SBV1_2130014 [Verrucomicrobia bacterium]|nr:hypothetical protein SBV1_2130014 [Verrucomicrobiota bacterium]